MLVLEIEAVKYYEGSAQVMDSFCIDRRFVNAEFALEYLEACQSQGWELVRVEEVN